MNIRIQSVLPTVVGSKVNPVFGLWQLRGECEAAVENYAGFFSWLALDDSHIPRS